MAHGGTSLFDRMLSHRPLAVTLLLGFTGAMGAFASRVHPDFSVEMAFPSFDRSRVDYERFKHDFPFEDARAILAVEANDLFTPAGLKRIAALENDLQHVPNVIDTRGLSTVKDVVADGDGIKMDKLFPSPDAPADELAHGRVTATSDPLYTWNVAPPDGHATIIEITLSKEAASRDAGRTAFLRAARAVIAQHAEAARRAGVEQKLTLNGLPVVRAEFVELINSDLNRLFPIAFLVVVLLLQLTFRNLSDVFASVVTILFSVIWTVGAMGVARVPLHVLTQLTPIVVMIVSISDTVHVVTHYKEHIRAGGESRAGIVSACVHSAFPCLLTEVTIAGGFLGLVANDIVMIQHFGVVTAAGMMLTWLANFTVLPLMLSFLKPTVRSERAVQAEQMSAAARLFQRFSQWIERMITTRPRRVVAGAAAIAGISLAFSARSGKEFYVYDDLRPNAQLARNLRYIESVHGGTVPMAVFIEPKEKGRVPDAMLEPQAMALIDRITHRVEADFPREVKNAASISKYLRKAHRLLAGEEVARATPLPQSRSLTAQELLAIDDPRALRDVLSFDRGTAAVSTMVPDEGSSHATQLIAKLRAYLTDEEKATGYKITLTGVFAISDGVYQALVGGLLGSLAVAVLISFLIFCAVLRSWRLAAIALVPNLLPLIFTLGFMSALHIDIKPSTVIIFSITLVIADDDTIQYMARLRDSYVARRKSGDADPHRGAALETLREMGLPMFVTACAVSVGFLALLFSEFLALANLGLLIGVSLLSAVFADLFLSPLLIMTLKPKVGSE
jgi:predicted RND superfamily exporter protein